MTESSAPENQTQSAVEPVDQEAAAVEATAATSASESELAAMDREQLQQHIDALERKLARQRSRPTGLLNESQQRQLLDLLEKQDSGDALTKQLQQLIERAAELNQQSEQIQQEIQGLNIVSENATNKCYEITYGAQHVIDQNEKLQRSLNEHLERSKELNDQSQRLAEALERDIEHSELARQKMDSATDRAHSVYQKSRQLLEDITACRADVDEQARSVHEVTEASKQANAESEVLQRGLEVLRQQLLQKIEEQEQHLADGREVVKICKKLANEIAQGKHETDAVLAQVTEGNEASKTLIARMGEVIESGIKKQQENRALNLDLQHSLQRNQQQREELMVLTSECREIRDESMEVHKRNETSMKESLEKVSVSVAESKQTQRQAETLLKEVFENNHESKALIARMSELSETAESIQSDNDGLNKRLHEVLETSTSTGQELSELADACRDTRDRSEELLQTSTQINADSQASIERINDYMDSMRSTKEELKELIQASNQSNDQAAESLEAMRTNINNSSLIQKECMRLNKESVATTLEAKRITEKLSEELESSYKLNKHYQDRLKSAEEKYRAAVDAEAHYKTLHEQTLKALKENEVLLADATATIKEHSDSSSEYNNTVKQFQQTTVQSQQIILETQASIKTLLANNDQLAEENRFLKQQLKKPAAMTPDNVWPDIDNELQSDPELTNNLEAQINRMDKNWA